MTDKGEFNGITTEALVDELGRRMKLTTKEAGEFKHMALKRCGYRMVPKYVRAEDDNEQDDDNDDYPF
jgi:hypothetical protein